MPGQLSRKAKEEAPCPQQRPFSHHPDKTPASCPPSTIPESAAKSHSVWDPAFPTPQLWEAQSESWERGAFSAPMETWDWLRKSQMLTCQLQGNCDRTVGETSRCHGWWDAGIVTAALSSPSPSPSTEKVCLGEEVGPISLRKALSPCPSAWKRNLSSAPPGKSPTEVTSKPFLATESVRKQCPIPPTW